MSDKPQVTILWGECFEEDDRPKTYTFNTKAELDAFMLGVAECDGWMAFHVDDDINGARRGAGQSQFPELPDYVPDDEEENADA